MGIEKTLFKSKELKSSAEIAQMLRQISDKLETGILKLGNQENEVQIDFPEQMRFELKHKEEQGSKLERSFKIQLKWYIGEKPAGETKIL